MAWPHHCWEALGGMGKAFIARGGHRSYTGKSRCIPTIRRDTSGLTHATRILSSDEALVSLATRLGYKFYDNPLCILGPGGWLAMISASASSICSHL